MRRIGIQLGFRRGLRGDPGIPMQILWIVAYLVTAAFVVLILPFTIFYYEAEDPDQPKASKQVVEAVKYTAISIVIFVIFTVVGWVLLGTAQVPIENLYFSANVYNDGFTDYSLVSYANFVRGMQGANDAQLEFQVTFILYIIGVLNLGGVFCLVIFGGIGLSALPVDLLMAWRNRPRYMTKGAYQMYQEPILDRSIQLLEVGYRMKEKMKRTGGQPSGGRARRAYNKFRKDVFLLEERFNTLEKAYNRGIGPKLLTIIWAWIQLVLGVVAIVTSVLWIVQIFIVLIIKVPGNVFLSKMFNTLDAAFGLFGVCAYGVFAFYLLWCIFAGNFRFGLRVPFLFSIHPMKVGETMMNAFLFNTLLLLLSAVAVVQFCTDAFNAYTRLTGSDVIFNTGIKTLKGTKYIWFYYPYVLIALTFIAGAYFVVYPAVKPKKDKYGFLVKAKDA
ncbi:hypothetical protein PROFUN_04609 [Planoprotostelium fungivorum]|uniref:Uncharacterized protein n=1 Tax=Planoprotostelium fungivorum TaxID=1890364 RepID=A0A2P6NUD7_9EUKA|nr:hypothetical protein PROFUN_04609 [Planoprotostelium fungivorum]